MNNKAQVKTSFVRTCIERHTSLWVSWPVVGFRKAAAIVLLQAVQRLQTGKGQALGGMSH
eukprot:2601942-Amphidinium_carterae.1